MAMATGVPHEDSPELTPLAQDVPNPLALAAAGSDLAKVEVEREDALQGDGQAGDQMEVKDEDEEMDEMDSDGEGDAEDYERERARIIKENASLMAQLGLSNGAAIPHAHTNPNGSAHLSKSGKAGGSSEKKPALSTEERRIQRQARAQAAALKRQIQPSRRSGRVAAMASKADYTGDGSESPAPPSPPTYSLSKPSLPKVAAPFIPSGPEYDLTADDAGEYETRAPPPTRALDGTLVFEGRWKGVFTPNVTPEEMFRGGAFGGAFFCDTYSQSLRAPLPSAPDIASLPFPFPAHLIPTHLTAPEPDGSVNRFKQRAGQSLQAWEKAGWIWGVDPRGWAQWYCRFWAGRRGVDDERQIRRWIKVAGPTGRFKRSLLSTIQSRGGRAVLANEDVGRVVRQTLWQWAYELTESEYDRAMEGA